MKAIAAHFRYITRNGRLEIEDDRGAVEHGKEALLDIERQWRLGGAYIPDIGQRREAFNVMLSMPRGTDPESVLFAAREFAKIEFADHRYVMVLHDHQANPHVHLTVKAESKHGKRLNPRKADLHRWREVFAEQLRERGIDAEATRQVARGPYRKREELWQVKAREEGRLRVHRRATAVGIPVQPVVRRRSMPGRRSRPFSRTPSSHEDRLLASEIVEFVRDAPTPRRAEQRPSRPSRRQPSARSSTHRSACNPLPVEIGRALRSSDRAAERAVEGSPSHASDRLRKAHLRASKALIDPKRPYRSHDSVLGTGH